MKHCLYILFSLLLLTACSGRPTHATHAATQPKIFPDYIGVTIPAEIAPLNFDFAGADCQNLYAEVKGSRSGQMTAQGSSIDFDIDSWHELTRANRGADLIVTLYVKADGQWTQYRPFKIHVSRYPLPDYGLTYRRIAPGYEVFGKMGIYERRLADFSERAIFENTESPGACVNCHTANRTNPSRFTFHIRGQHGATLISRDGQAELLKAKNEELGGSLVYPYWHPSGRYCAYSTNNTHQGFHSVRSERIEVFDQSSDVMVYDTERHQVLCSPLLMTRDHFETYPAFSPDGRWLYFCSSQAKEIPAGYKQIKYNLCRIAFDARTGRFGQQVDTIFNARQLGKSAIHPRPSYDGRYLMFTMADYGCFPIWHREADNWLLDLKTQKAAPLTAANSPGTDSWHNWSRGSHWFVFTSRRIDGLYTRLYLACIDGHGRVTKPFLLPQRHPQRYYDELMLSYNTPDFTSRPVELSAHRLAKKIESDERAAWSLKHQK